MKKTRVVSLVTLICLAATMDVRGALLVYEGFNYPPGQNILIPLNGGTGFSDPWARAEEGANDSITVYTGAPGIAGTNGPQTTVGNLDGVFNNPAVTTSPGGNANRYIDGASGDDRITALRRLSQSAGAMAGADKVLWASILWTMNGNNFGRQVGFVLGTDGLRNRSQNISTSLTWGGSGDGDAIGVGGAINSQAVTPTIWDGGSVVVRTTTGAKNLSYTYDNIVILKFVFADGTDPDTVYAWAFGENETITEDAFTNNAVSASAVIDQDTLNILSFGQSQVGIETVDEIRLGDTFEDVISGLPEPPEPLEFTSIVHDPISDQTTLTWKSNPGENYGLYWSEGVTNFVPGINPAIPASFGTNRTSYGPFTNPSPGAVRQFYRLGPADLVDPMLTKIWGSTSNITLTFSEAMHPTPATNPANYSILKNGSTPVSFTGVTLSPDGRTVTLALGASLDLGTAYEVTMNNLTDVAGRLLGNPTTGNFQTYDNNPNGVKVFILAGQSNMVGHGKDDQGTNDVYGAIGSLRYLVTNNLAAYGQLLVDTNDPAFSPWATRDDVKVWWRDSDITAARAVIKGDLKIGYSQSRNPDWFGPEYAFGWVLGDYYTNPVLIIKTAWGGKSLQVDYRPPTAAATRGGVVGPYYTGMIEYVRDCLSNLDTEFPEFTGMGYQIVGFGWHQGWNDRINGTYSANYESNLVDLITDLRTEFGVPNLAVSIGTTGMEPQPAYTVVEQAQLNVANPSLHPELGGNVFTDDTRPYWREASISPSSFGYHWNHNGESHYFIGKGMGEGMTSMLPPP